MVIDGEYVPQTTISLHGKIAKKMAVSHLTSNDEALKRKHQMEANGVILELLKESQEDHMLGICDTDLICTPRCRHCNEEKQWI